MTYGVSNGHVTDDVTLPQRFCEAVRSAIPSTAWLLVLNVMRYINPRSTYLLTYGLTGCRRAECPGQRGVGVETGVSPAAAYRRRRATGEAPGAPRQSVPGRRPATTSQTAAVDDGPLCRSPLRRLTDGVHSQFSPRHGYRQQKVCIVHK